MFASCLVQCKDGKFYSGMIVKKFPDGKLSVHFVHDDARRTIDPGRPLC
jgi:hypothetical protein